MLPSDETMYPAKHGPHCSVGASVSAAVGAVVGEAVRAAVGCIVGTPVGRLLGDAVGRVVTGAAVGGAVMVVELGVVPGLADGRLCIVVRVGPRVELTVVVALDALLLLAFAGGSQ